MAATPTQATPTIVRTADAARVFSGLDSRAIASVVETLDSFKQSAKLVDMSALHAAAKAMGPIVAPQIADSLTGIEQRIIASSSTFNFAKTVGDLNAATIQPRFAQSVADSLATLGAANAFSAGIADMLRDLSRVFPADLAPRVEEAAGEAVALAEVDVAEIVDEATRLLPDMAPAQRMLAIEVAFLLAAFLTLAAVFAESSDPKNQKVAAAALACAAALVRVFWRVTGKLD
jgi:hypothetical protein